ncbi:MAG: hypothetical protein U1E76_17325 [Planctomycetota bacterium]
MQQAALVHVLDCASATRATIDAASVKPSDRLGRLLEKVAPDQIHHQVRHRLVHAAVAHAHDAGMCELAQQHRLALEATERARMEARAGGEHLDRHLAAVRRHRAQHVRRAATAERTQDLVAADRFGGPHAITQKLLGLGRAAQRPQQRRGQV